MNDRKAATENTERTVFVFSCLPWHRPLFPGEGWSRFEQLVNDYAPAEAQEHLEQALKLLKDR